LKTSINNYNNTRIAPTPSGFLHVGNVLSFVITSALAQKNNSKVLLRIDDLDQVRTNNQYLQDIFDTLNYLEIPWDNGPGNVQEFQDQWSQIHRMDSYNTAIRELCVKGVVFACTCSRSQIRTSKPCTCFEKHIPLDTENASLRLITCNKELEVRNYSGQIIHTALPAEMKNFIIRRRDGIPSYQLASVVDDLYYNIDLVVRGEDLWSSTIAQHELASALGENRFREITFYHHPLLMEAQGKKLSKSAGATSIRNLRENGKKPSDIYTLIAGMLDINDKVINWEQLARIMHDDWQPGS
jgi:glutamyl/glutaminyl-tRNA synthetase